MTQKKVEGGSEKCINIGGYSLQLICGVVNKKWCEYD